MPFPMKIQPIDSYTELTRNESGKPVLKSRLKRLFDRQFPSVLRISSVDKPSAGGGGGESQYSNKEAAVTEFEPSSLCLDKMVRNFIEDNNNANNSDKPSGQKCGRNRCNCFNGNSGSGSSDDDEEDFDVLGIAFDESIPMPVEAAEMLKGLIPCSSVAERNLLADAAKIADKNKHCKRKDDLRRVVADGLSSLTYDASVCKSRWDKSPSCPAGEYEFIDVIAEGGEKLVVDVDFRSEFEIARPTGTYKAILQSLPYLFVGKSDRLQQIVAVVSEAARQSLRKKGMPVPPWRTGAYMRAKWVSPRTRTAKNEPSSGSHPGARPELIFGDPSPPESLPESKSGEVESPPTTESTQLSPGAAKPSSPDEKLATAMVFSPWQPPAVKPKSCDRGAKIVPGLASLLSEKP